jgi:hypothetical protein
MSSKRTLLDEVRTFERAREQVGIEPIGKSQLREMLGEEFDWVPSEDLPPKAAWVRLGDAATPQLPTG